MESTILDTFMGPILVPLVLYIRVARQYKEGNLDLLYATIAFATGLSTFYSILQFYLTRHIQSRVYLTLFIAKLLTLFGVLSVIGFHFIRLNFDNYALPDSVRSQDLTSSSSVVFRHHFFADFIPGLIIFSQTQVYSIANHYLLVKAKRSFTLGEASTVSQLLSSSYLVWALAEYSRFSNAGPFKVNLTTEIVLNLGIYLFIIVLLPSYLFVRGKGTIERYSLLAGCLAACYTRTQMLLEEAGSELDPPTWFVGHILETHQRVSLFMLWLLTLTGCVSFASIWSKLLGETNSLVRKVFHIAVCIVFISGFHNDFEFARFAAGGMVVVFIGLETIRAWQLEPFGEPFENVCKAIRGGWDNRYMTVSHIYLLVGTFIPFWLIPVEPNSAANRLLLSSGMISLGVGDTAAAIIGSYFGRTRIGKSKKTHEGLLGNFAAMCLVKICWIGYTGFLSEFGFFMAAILTSFVEALTTGCDNLSLPLTMVLFLEIF